jgi:polysaccharide biosynthesis transport protein
MEAKESSLSFDRYWLILKRRWLVGLAVLPPVFVAVFLLLASRKADYVAEGALRFQKTNTASSLTGFAKELGDLTPLAEKTNPLSTEGEVIRSSEVVQSTIQQLNLKNDKGKSIKEKQFLGGLTVSEVQKTDILKVSYKHTNPQKAAEIVNTLINVYLNKNVAYHRSEVTAARKFLEKQVPQVELMLRKAESQLRQFKERNKIVNLEQEATKSVELISNLQNEVNQAKSKISDVNSQAESIRKQLGMNSQQALTMASLSQSPGIQDSFKEVQQVESQLAARRSVLQDSHPEIINLESKLESLQGVLRERIKKITGSSEIQSDANLQIGGIKQNLAAKLIELESNRLGLASEVFTLSNIQNSYRQRLNILPRLEQQQRNLERELQTTQATYTLLIQKLEETRIAENQNIGNVRIVSKAEVPVEPAVSPSSSYYVAGLISIFASVAAMYLLEARDKSLKTVDEAKELLDLTLLGVIPSFSKSKKSLRHSEEQDLYSRRLVVRDTPRSPISEAYRMLRANLKYISADKEMRVIVVTSSVPKEGKSTVSANLATAIAQMERKVLLVDADLHCPVQHQIWDTRNDTGLSNVIVGQSPLRNAIKRVLPNLDVLTAGVVPPSPSSLLDSKRMALLIEGFAAHYDFVIIDAPSLNVAADAATLGQMADGVLFVVRPGVVDSVNANLAKELLEKSGQNVIGQVVNGIIAENEPHSYYYFAEEYHSEEVVKTDTFTGVGNG